MTLWPEKEAFKLTRAHYFTSNCVWSQVFSSSFKKIQKKNLPVIHKQSHSEQLKFVLYNTLIHTFSLPGYKTQGGRCKVTLAGSRTSWWVCILSWPWLGPTCFCLYLLGAAQSLVLSVRNGNEPSYFWALFYVCRQTWRPLLFFTQDRTLFFTKRASDNYESAFISSLKKKKKQKVGSKREWQSSFMQL